MTEELKKTRGRPKMFDNEVILDKALKVFWERGYEGASMAELTSTLGVNKPSLYAAFGNKEELFRQALSKYVSGPASFVRMVMKEPTARKVAEKFLLSSAEFLTSEAHPKGCMIVQGALSCGEGAQIIKEQLIQYRKHYEGLLTERFELAQLEGDLSPDVNAVDLSKYLATLHQGMSVQAVNGATQEELKRMVNVAMLNWPSK
ncbi:MULTISPECIES: TetR/AcrR family transcriptional regulator [unclassified Methylophilus]|uniref:TetR/AcrR family transcriptional regulator n=1 Tax=unclassified Methylophilus TaxID=2630143 RepID=UPI0023B2096D|nr:TetR/AcrR family transcriptional regulator [Methylophilus sp. YYY-1]MDF0377600.1 TetR family transcriptional regulator [Methylophilus sp. YYY-1]BEV08883.1 TetR/AcrR family transcriptional regulator [Methylophilus sp. DW102]